MADPTTQSSPPAWPLTPDYRRDLFAGTARHYAQYRVPYPATMLEQLRLGAEVTGQGRLLDLACGTGEVALELGPFFREVWAVDQEPDMIEVGREKAADRNATNVHWAVHRAEDFTAEPDSLELITIGNAFHRLDRPLVARRAMAWLEPGRCLAVLGSSSLWSGTAEWQPLVIDVIRKWTRPPAGPAPQAAAPAAEQPRLTHEEVLQAAGFADVKEYQFPTPHVWTTEEFIGYLHSTSVISETTAGEAAEEFEADLRRALLAYDPSGRYRETIEFYYILARRPVAVD